MKDKLAWAAGVVIGLVMLLAILYGMRLFSNISTPITVQQVKPGVSCATMVTSDGAAISCWKD